MKGTVAPPSSRATVATTCAGLTESSLAMRISTEGSTTRSPVWAEGDANYAECGKAQQDLHSPRYAAPGAAQAVSRSRAAQSLLMASATSVQITPESR